jgi:poly-gamma-glutamate synthesis protein (capsule biosynthesis protein)
MMISHFKTLLFVFFLPFITIFFTKLLLANVMPTPIPIQAKTVQKDSIITLNIKAVGDLMCHSSQYQFANEQGIYDFSPMYRLVKSYLSNADYTIGNLETVLAADTKDYSGYPAFNTPNEYADALKDAGFDLLFTSNNHSYDRHEKGVLRTLKELEKRNLVPIGTFYNQRDRDSIRIVNLKGIKIAFLGYTQFSNIPVAPNIKYLVNHIDTSLIQRDVIEARRLGAELVVVNYHWGNEYKPPSDYQKAIAQFTKKLGVDIIIGEHPHVLQPVEVFKNQGLQTLDTGVIAYSLGNFISSQQWRYSDAGAILNIELTKNLRTQKIKISKLSYLPTWVFKGAMQGKNRFLIFPAESASALNNPESDKSTLPYELALITATHLEKMKQAAEDTRLCLQSYNAPIQSDVWYIKSKVPQNQWFDLPIINYQPNFIGKPTLPKILEIKATPLPIQKRIRKK